MNNSQLGLYSYTGNSYRQEGLDLNSSADPYYHARSLQEISYNAALGRSHMYYGGEQVDKMLRPYRRHYAEDGGVEITKDMLAGTTSFVFYLDGDAYSAPAIWKEVHGSTPTTKNCITCTVTIWGAS